MEKIKMLGVVTLYNSDKDQTLRYISLYAPHLDRLVVWDNSADSHQEWFQEPHIDYHWTGKNTLIAPAVNYAWRLAEQEGFDAILLMDDDSRWNDFPSYRNDIEALLTQGKCMVFTPYVNGCDNFQIKNDIQDRRLFINSGTVIPTTILRSIGGVDESAFPLDALDHDIALSAQEHGFQTVCLTRHRLDHSLGYPQLLGPFRLFTPNYDRLRTYNMTRSHIICYRKHRSLMTSTDKDYLFNEIIRRKFFRILLAEPDKLGRLSALIKGIISGYSYKLKKR